MENLPRDTLGTPGPKRKLFWSRSRVGKDVILRNERSHLWLTGDNRVVACVDQRQHVVVLAQEQVSLEEEVGLVETEVKVEMNSLGRWKGYSQQQQEVHGDLDDIVVDDAIKDLCVCIFVCRINPRIQQQYGFPR